MDGIGRRTPGHLAVSAANAPVSVVLPAKLDDQLFLAGVEWSFDRPPLATLSIQFGANLVKQWFILNEGPGAIMWVPPIVAPKNTAITVTLSAGGKNVLATLMVNEYEQLP